MNKDFLWVEKYRPKTIEETILPAELKATFQQFVDQKNIPNLILSGSAGVGKTTVARAMLEELGCDYIIINGSNEGRMIDTLRNEIANFASSVSLAGGRKYVILDEADYLTPNAQAALRNLMETFSKTTRFVLTCNYVEKIIDPIQSRCQVFGITPPSKKDVAIRINSILHTEGVTAKPEDLVSIINSGYPDIRRILNSCQRQVVNGELKIDKQSLIESNYVDKIVTLLSSKPDKKQLFTSIRQLLADSQVKDYTALYRSLYDNLDSFATGFNLPSRTN